MRAIDDNRVLLVEREKIQIKGRRCMHPYKKILLHNLRGGNAREDNI